MERIKLLREFIIYFQTNFGHDFLPTLLEFCPVAFFAPDLSNVWPLVSSHWPLAKWNSRCIVCQYRWIHHFPVNSDDTLPSCQIIALSVRKDFVWVMKIQHAFCSNDVLQLSFHWRKRSNSQNLIFDEFCEIIRYFVQYLQNFVLFWFNPIFINVGII